MKIHKSVFEKNIEMQETSKMRLMNFIESSKTQVPVRLLLMKLQ